MVQNTYSDGDACCFTSPVPAVDPLAADNIVVAGNVGEDGCTAAGDVGGCALAMVYFPVQEYRAGFCPGEALRRGTLFPELASDYVGGCC